MDDLITDLKLTEQRFRGCPGGTGRTAVRAIAELTRLRAENEAYADGESLHRAFLAQAKKNESIARDDAIRLRAIVQRVKDECGPAKCSRSYLVLGQWKEEEWWQCDSKHCQKWAESPDKIEHTDRCLWLAADKALTAQGGEG
jgi:hypothetical protein